jgi:glycosyltransferase involved in cell wall biosynthesis
LEKRIIFTGIVGREDIKNYFVAGDIFIYASKSETQGMIITEAMYAGLPIVAVKATGIESLVENGKNGILTSENKQEFTLAIKKLVEDRESRKKMAEESARIAREKYASKVCAQKMLGIYEKSIKRKK